MKWPLWGLQMTMRLHGYRLQSRWDVVMAALYACSERGGKDGVKLRRRIVTIADTVQRLLPKICATLYYSDQNAKTSREGREKRKLPCGKAGKNTRIHN